MAAQDPTPKEDTQREERIQRILRQVEHELRKSLPHPLQPLEKTEQEIVEIGRRFREVVERETVVDAGSGYLGSHATCTCGKPARYVAGYKRHLITLNGTLRLTRAYYHCVVNP